jgi:hypothetical protein
MACSPLARWKNFTLENLKYVLNIYKDSYNGEKWKDVEPLIESEMPGYVTTATQWTNQFGIEYRDAKRTTLECPYQIQSYLKKLDDEKLSLYIKFWISTYYVPNVRVSAQGEDPIIIYLELGKEILSSPNRSVIFSDFFNKYFSGPSDIIYNVLKASGPFLENSVPTVFTVSIDQIQAFRDFLKKIEEFFPIPIYNQAMATSDFFHRYSYANFNLFKEILDSCNNDSVTNTNKEIQPYNEHASKKYLFSTAVKGNNNFQYKNILFKGVPGTGKSRAIDEIIITPPIN